MHTLVFQEELHEVAEWIQVCDEDETETRARGRTGR